MQVENKVTVVRANICPECESVVKEQSISLSEKELEKLMQENTRETLFLSSAKCGGAYRWLVYDKRCRVC